MPAALAGTLAGIRGLNNFRLKAHARVGDKVVPYAVGARSAGLTPAATDGGNPPNEYVAPEDFAKIYDVTPLYNAGFNGSTAYPIAVMGQSAVFAADISAFRSAFGLSTSNMPIMVLEPGTGTAVTNTNDLSESELDLEWSGAVAPSAPIYFIYTGSTSANGVFDALQYTIQSYTVSGKPIPIISLSYGSCEADDTASDYAMYEGWFKQANAQGQTILNSSGDQGAAGCDYTTVSTNNYSATRGLAVSYPASSAYVTGVGGTSFSGDLTSNSTYWATTNDNNFGNELGLYIPSSTWNDTPTTATAITNTGLSASGGGVSSLWPKPSWQSNVPGIPTDGKRDVPDIALSADPNHDGFLVCIDSSCAGSNGYFNVYGGTSVAAPSFAGILALTEQKLGAVQGNLNPSMYTLASNGTKYASAFHDITTGTNIVPCVVAASDVGCSGGSMGYTAGSGYDLVTGLGAPDANNFASALAGVVPLTSTTNTLTYTPSAPSTNQTVSFTATIGASNLTTPPTGNVVFTVDGAATGTTVTLTGTGSATFTATFVTGGPHTVAAVYSGDGNYYGSTSTATVTVTIASNPVPAATSTTLALNKSTVAVGGSLTLTANVSSAAAGTLAGSVTFLSANGVSLGTVNLSVTGSTGTALLTLNVTSAALPTGADSITATFNGGGTSGGGSTFGPSTSAAASLTVTNPTITLAAPNISIASGAIGTSTVTITAMGGYAGTVVLNATATSQTLLNDASVVFNPASVTFSPGGATTATSTFSISTNSVTPAVKGGGGRLSDSRISMLAAGAGVSFAGLLLFGLRGTRRRRLPSVLFSLLAFALLASAMGCGSSSSNTGGGGGTSGPTGVNVPAGTYTVTLIGTDSVTGSITNSVNITLTLH